MFSKFAERAARLGVLGLLACGVVGCASLPIAPRGATRDEVAYTERHPFYLEFCALSEIEKNPGYGAEVSSGFGGHSTIYLNGACRVGSGYPELAVCADNPAWNGVGLSVNAHFANANWVAIPGRAFFYHGDLQPGQALTREVYEATKAHAMRLGFYDAVRYHDWVFDHLPPGYTRRDWKYELPVGTDYAIGFGRDRYCARVPVSARQMARIVDFLNGLNRPYRDGRAEYEWNVLTNNCIHVAHNALAAIGFWRPWRTYLHVLFAAFDFPVPKNEFVNIARRANDMPLDDLLAVWRDKPTRRAVLDGDGLPTREGALVTLQAVARPNALYETDLRLIFYDEPLTGPYEGWWRSIVAEPRYSDADANQRYFAALYGRILAERRPLAWWLEAHPRLKSEPAFPAFYERFYAEVAGRAASVEAVGPEATNRAASPVLDHSPAVH